MKDKIIYHDIDPYGFRLWLVVTDDFIKAQERPWVEKTFGKSDTLDAAALTLHCENASRGAIFIDKKYLYHEIISHEVFHATHRVLERAGHKFSEDGHEPYAYLSGYITKLIYNDLSKWKIRVKRN